MYSICVPVDRRRSKVRFDPGWGRGSSPGDTPYPRPMCGGPRRRWGPAEQAEKRLLGHILRVGRPAQIYHGQTVDRRAIGVVVRGEGGRGTNFTGTDVSAAVCVPKGAEISGKISCL